MNIYKLVPFLLIGILCLNGNDLNRIEDVSIDGIIGSKIKFKSNGKNDEITIKEDFKIYAQIKDNLESLVDGQNVSVDFIEIGENLNRVYIKRIVAVPNQESEFQHEIMVQRKKINGQIRWRFNIPYVQVRHRLLEILPGEEIEILNVIEIPFEEVIGLNVNIIYQNDSDNKKIGRWAWLVNGGSELKAHAKKSKDKTINVENEYLIKDGSSNFAIVIPDNVNKMHFPEQTSLLYAAEFINRYLQKSTNVILPIIEESRVNYQFRKIYLGSTKYANDYIGNLNELNNEEYFVKSIDNDYIICGKIHDGIDQGTLFGVYDFLENIAGIRWYFLDHSNMNAGIRIPDSNYIKNDDIDINSYPKFIHRGGLIRHWGLPEWERRLWHPILRFGDTRNSRTPNHTQTYWYHLYHETNPDFFAKTYNNIPRINHRTPAYNFICLSNDAVIDQMIENIKDFDLTGNKRPFGNAPPDENNVYFVPNDGLSPYWACKCTDCREKINLNTRFEGQLSNLVWSFINKYAARIKEHWPERRLGVLAYASYQDPPVGIEIPGNVDVTLVHSDINWMHDESIWNNNMSQFDNWKQIMGGDGRRIGLWHNTGVLNLYSYVPAMYPQSFLDAMKYYRASGVIDMFTNGFNPHLQRPHWTVNQKRMAASLYPFMWIQGKILWDPENLSMDDIIDLLEIYCSDLYGNSNEIMLSFYKKIIAQWESLGYSRSALGREEFMYHVQFPDSVSRGLIEILDEAIKNIEGVTDQLKYYEWIVHLRNDVYKSFFNEIDNFSSSFEKASKEYLCTIGQDDDNVFDYLSNFWSHHPIITLNDSRWGNESRKETLIRLYADDDFLFANVTMCIDEKMDLSKNEIRIQFANKFSNIGEAYSPNINKQWNEFKEIRVNSMGEMVSFDGINSEVFRSVDENLVNLIIKIPFNEIPKLCKNNSLHMQFLRYWDNWREYDTWSPTLSNHLIHYPTSRFGRVYFSESSVLRTRDGLD